MVLAVPQPLELPIISSTPSYPPPYPNANLHCYMENRAPCGSKFYLVWTISRPLQRYFVSVARSGHTKTGIGNVTEKAFNSEGDMVKYVSSQISSRKRRKGEKVSELRKK